LIYSRTKSVTQNIRGFVGRLLKAAQTVFGDRMRLSTQWLRTTALSPFNSTTAYDTVR